jgi:hypothetical protein
MKTLMEKKMVAVLILLFINQLIYSQVETTEYNVRVLNTNFSLPILRFNTANKDSSGGNPIGNVSFFNSIGAGISFNWSKLKIVTNKQTKEEVSNEMSNIFGIQLGVLFSSNSSSGANSNIFAPTLSVSVLDFQVGYGYELGTINLSQKRGFFTISYGIPLYKLTSKGSFIISKKESSEANNNNKSRFLKE